MVDNYAKIRRVELTGAVSTLAQFTCTGSCFAHVAADADGHVWVLRPGGGINADCSLLVGKYDGSLVYTFGKAGLCARVNTGDYDTYFPMRSAGSLRTAPLYNPAALAFPPNTTGLGILAERVSVSGTERVWMGGTLRLMHGYCLHSDASLCPVATTVAAAPIPAHNYSSWAVGTA